MSSVILVCAATSIEAKACRRGIEQVGKSARFEIIQTGMGLDNARTGLARRLDDLSLPSVTQVISAGFAGSWTRQLSVGDWVLGRTVELQSGTHRFELEGLTLPSKISFPFRNSRIISLAQASSDGAVNSTTGDAVSLPVVVDMESYAWAEICQHHRIPFQVIRMVSDNPDAPLPKAVGAFASVFTAPSVQTKFRSLFQGVQHAASEPMNLARFVARGTQLPGLLERGWQELASE